MSMTSPPTAKALQNASAKVAAQTGQKEPYSRPINAMPNKEREQALAQALRQ